MTTNTDRPVGPGTFTRDSYSVTIAEDGKILVKKDDWLSKYSWALYGDFDTLHVFVRPNPAIISPTQEIKGIKEIENADLIETGEYLIHEPTYFHWMERRGIKPPAPRKPNPDTPVKPERRKSGHWMAADYGGLEGVYFVGSAGAKVLAFLNLDDGQTYYYVLLHAGGGLGLEIGDIFKGVKNLLRAAARRSVKKKPKIKFIPVMANYPFSARTLEELTINCYSETIKIGVGKNYSYEKIRGYFSSSDCFSVVFEEDKWLGIPGGGVSLTGGKLIWVW